MANALLNKIKAAEKKSDRADLDKLMVKITAGKASAAELTEAKELAGKLGRKSSR
jgi:hypothetical protein